MSHYDVKFGEAVVMTVELEAAANRLAEALNDAASYGFQTEGLKASVEECDRGAGVLKLVPDEDPSDDDVYYALRAPDAQAWIRGHEEPDDVRALILTERAHPKYDGGRSGVLDDAEEYLGEMLTEE